MDIKKTVAEAMDKPINRRQFLAQAGAVALSVVGVGAIVKSLSPAKTHGGTGHYGMGAYGGYDLPGTQSKPRQS